MKVKNLSDKACREILQQIVEKLDELQPKVSEGQRKDQLPEKICECGDKHECSGQFQKSESSPSEKGCDERAKTRQMMSLDGKACHCCLCHHDITCEHYQSKRDKVKLNDDEWRQMGIDPIKKRNDEVEEKIKEILHDIHSFIAHSMKGRDEFEEDLRELIRMARESR